MNRDQIKGRTKEVAGKIQEKTGKLVGSKTHEASGLTKQAAGKVQKSYGDAKESAKRVARKTH